MRVVCFMLHVFDCVYYLISLCLITIVFSLFCSCCYCCCCLLFVCFFLCCSCWFCRGFFVVAVVACLFDLLVCLIMTCALLKYDLSIRVVLGIEAFFLKQTNKQTNRQILLRFSV